MPVYEVTSYQITLRTVGIFTGPIIELDVIGMSDSVVIRYDVPDLQSSGLYAVHHPVLGLLGCHALMSDYERHVDLLRYERPVFFKVSPPGMSFEGSGYSDLEGRDLIWALATHTEPVGEGPADESLASERAYLAFQGHKYGLVDAVVVDAPKKDD